MPGRTLRAQNRTHFREGSRARFRALQALGLSCAIWALFLSILILKNWIKKHIVGPILGGRPPPPPPPLDPPLPFVKRALVWLIRFDWIWLNFIRFWSGWMWGTWLTWIYIIPYESLFTWYVLIWFDLIWFEWFVIAAECNNRQTNNISMVIVTYLWVIAQLCTGLYSLDKWREKVSAMQKVVIHHGAWSQPNHHRLPGRPR